jgi:asparagine synthase (glutamine-hydrolysing)
MRREQACDRASGPLTHVIEALYARLRAEGCRVVMDGIGGDATLNPRGDLALAEMLLRGEWRRFARELRATARVRGLPMRRLAMHALRRVGAVRFSRFRRPRLRPPAQMLNGGLRERLTAPGELTTEVLMRHISERAMGEWSLDLMQARAFPNACNEAAAAGLVLTRPMIDKRVVEFACAIPEHLHYAAGRGRALARAALPDVLPPEFQTRLPGQEHYDPDFAAHVFASLPALREEAAMLRTRAAAAHFVDFDALDALLAAERPEDLDGGRAVYLTNAWLVANYVAGFTRAND